MIRNEFYDLVVLELFLSHPSSSRLVVLCELPLRQRLSNTSRRLYATECEKQHKMQLPSTTPSPSSFSLPHSTNSALLTSNIILGQIDPLILKMSIRKSQTTIIPSSSASFLLLR